MVWCLNHNVSLKIGSVCTSADTDKTIMKVNIQKVSTLVIAVAILGSALVGCSSQHGVAPSQQTHNAAVNKNAANAQKQNQAQAQAVNTAYKTEAAKFNCNVAKITVGGKTITPSSTAVSQYVCLFDKTPVVITHYPTAAALLAANPASAEGKIWGSTHYTDGVFVIQSTTKITDIAAQLSN